MHHSKKYQQAIAAFDQANSKDPNKEVVHGEEHPKELLYAQRMTEWLQKMNPDASEELCLAARCQHIERWVVPRDDYPKTRSGYIKWRNELKRYHAERAGEILREIDYDEKVIQRVQDLVMKKGLKKDPETQMLEDVICLVFLNYYFDEFSRQHDDEKLISILKKTWRKMSKNGRDQAINMNMSRRSRELVEKALA